MTDSATDITSIRREPPPLVPVVVAARDELTPRLLQLTFEGDGLATMAAPEPASSVRLLVPSPGTDELVTPKWNGNEFLLDDGTRPALRTFTPLRVDRDAGRLDLQIVRHPGGAVSTWAEHATLGAEAAISGPGSGYTIDEDAERFILLGDETAIPAISDLLGVIPHDAAVEVHIEIVQPDARLPLSEYPNASVTWHVGDEGAVPGGRLVEVVHGFDGLLETTRLWAAGEAASMHAIRKHVFKSLHVPRSQATIRGYWKPAR
ncbi:MAG: siderophore-interacting protein [Acidimicrobiia bacterium]|nr:siderophore-interacting protein [Acidimicrobiia bacterium]